ncbi:MAG: DUF1559 domain-containing protein [Planctomycetia bacterium]|nr:DUF1559 domain-containing protein [Planctomycetia bacterium]
MKKRRTGFTLVELLVVIVIIGLLMGITMPALSSARAAARQTQCTNNISQISKATLTYETNEKKLPRGLGCYIDRHEWLRHSWYPYLLASMDQQQLYLTYMEHYDVPESQRTGTYDYTYLPDKQAIVPSFLCPDDPNTGKVQNGSSTTNQQGFHGNYMGNGGNTYFNASGSSGYLQSAEINGIFPAKRQLRMSSIRDGQSQTLFFSEILIVPDGAVGTGSEDIRGRYLNGRHAGLLFSTLYQPNTLMPDRHNYCISEIYAPCVATGSNVIVSARSNHVGGVVASYCDGHADFIPDEIDMEVYHAIGSRNGQEVYTLEY